MKPQVAAIALLLASLSWVPVCAQTGADDEVLTNESVVKLVQSGLGSNLVVKMIQNQPTSFRLGSASVIQLKQKGVPQAVIAAMLSKKEGPSPSAGSPGEAPKSAVPNDAWSENEKTDPITGRKTFAVDLDTPALSEDAGKRQGTFEIAATCSGTATTLNVVFSPDGKAELGFKQNSEQYLVPGGLAGALTMATHHQKPWTVTRIRVGDGEGKQVTSESDYKNVADIYFNVPQQDTPAATQDEAGARALVQFANFLGPNKAAGSTEELFQAKAVLMEMELQNGIKTLLTLHPQDKTFQAFAQRCRKLMPGPLTATANELRPPPSIGTGPGGSIARNPAPNPARAAVRYVVPAGTLLTLRVTEAVDLDALHANRTVHAVLVHAISASAPNGTDAGPTALPLAAGTEIFLHCGAAAGFGDRLNVRLELDHALVHGAVVPLRSQIQTRQVSRGLSAPTRSADTGRYTRIPSQTGSNPIIVDNNEELTFSTSQATYAPYTYKP